MVDVLGLVLLELVLAREGHLAVEAAKGPQVGVARERVPLEVERRLERLAAQRTLLVRLHVIVLRGVLRQLLARLERL